MKKRSFPYLVNTEDAADAADGVCRAMIWHMRYHVRCRKLVKHLFDGIELCGLHISEVKQWRKQK